LREKTKKLKLMEEQNYTQAIEELEKIVTEIEN